MKNIFTTIISIVFFWLATHAQNYYVSSSATNSGSGSILSPWNSFAPLNILLATSVPIDTIFLKSGDIFRDQITISIASNFVITSYGTGIKPIISGADSLLNWTSISTYWQSNFSQPIVSFFVNNQEQILARYPDESSPYLTVDTGTTNSTLNDAGLSSISSTILNQSQVCVHTAQWCWEKSPVSSSTSSTITYLNPTLRLPTANYGYFLYDHISYLTAGKEWKYDATNQKIYYQPVSGDPNTFLCEASIRPYGILLDSGVENINISNITFEKQTESGIGIMDSTNQNIIIDNCNFARQYKYGVEVSGKYSKISNCYFREVDGLAVYLKVGGTGAEVHHNMFKNNGGFRNSGIGTQINLSSIKGAFVDSCHIHHNDIDSAGYCGIAMDGRWNVIDRNIIKNAMLLNNDGAALKSFGVASQYNIFKNNFVSSSDGNTDGTPPGNNFNTPAIYFDFSTNYCTIQENTVYNRTNKGIFLNSGTNNNTVIGNVVHGGNYCLDFNGGPVVPTPMTGMVVKHNSLFAKTPSAYVVRIIDNTGGYNQGIVDSNYYFQPYNSGKYALIAPSTDYTFAQWQTTGLDPNTKSSFVNWTSPASYDSLFMNQTDSVVTISLGTIEFLDLDSNVICGSITLQPYTSKILINNQTFCTTGIIESNFENGLSVFPNPFSSTTILKTVNIFKNVTLTIYNSLGKQVKQLKNISGNAVTLHRDNLPSGLYFISLTQDNKIITTGKIVITD